MESVKGARYPLLPFSSSLQWEGWRALDVIRFDTGLLLTQLDSDLGYRRDTIIIQFVKVLISNQLIYALALSM